MRIGITFDLKSPDAHGELPDDWQEEFDSPHTIQAIAEALRQQGHEPVLLGDGRRLIEHLLTDPPDLVFNFAEGEGVSRCREARVPAVLEMLGIPYTGSDPLCLAATLDKDVARRLVASHGVAVAPGFLVMPEDEASRLRTSCSFPEAPSVQAGPRLPSTATELLAPWSDAVASLRPGQTLAQLETVLATQGLSFPLIVKPAWEGSSKGIRQASLVHDLEALQRAVRQVHRDYRQPALVE
ncbi:D-alanine--D-alanine ligase [bacterium HR36]|nr:D-alanine--D-alanine ligase [bacterium HR36]